MVPWYWVLITGLVCAVIGLGFPRLCPRCKLERLWIDEAMKVLKQKEKKP